jgi:hypothetical protein
MHSLVAMFVCVSSENFGLVAQERVQGNIRVHPGHRVAHAKDERMEFQANRNVHDHKDQGKEETTYAYQHGGGDQLTPPHSVSTR